MSDIKFETINGTLCRMVEQPCPHCGQPEIIAERVEDNSHWWALHQMMHGKKVRYKGAFGNVYWALNQDGNVQYYDMADPAYIGSIRSKLVFCEIKWDNKIWQLYKETKPEPKFDIHINSRDWKGVSKTYTGIAMEKTRLIEDILSEKPKPLLADAKVGDLVKLETGKWHTIKAIVQQHESCLDFLVYGLDNGIHYAPNGNGMRTDSLIIVEWQPLAPEGSAEWAWQMNKLLGKKVMHPHSNCITDGNIMRENKGMFLAITFPTGWQLYEPEPEPEQEPDPKERPLRNLILRAKEHGMNIRTWYQGLIFTPESLTYYLNNGKFRWWNIGDWELTKREANMPMPEPEYKVGEWVEYGGKHYQITSVNHNCTFLGETLVMFSGVIWGVSDLTKLRKLDPSEVRVKITLEGQVTKPVDNAGGRFWLYYSTDEYVSIELDALSHKDRELVESLLKAQESENA